MSSRLWAFRWRRPEPKSVRLAEWTVPIAYFDGRCEALLKADGAWRLPDDQRRCANAAIDQRDGRAVCWQHRAPKVAVLDWNADAERFRFGTTPATSSSKPKLYAPDF